MKRARGLLVVILAALVCLLCVFTWDQLRERPNPTSPEPVWGSGEFLRCEGEETATADSDPGEEVSAPDVDEPAPQEDSAEAAVSHGSPEEGYTGEREDRGEESQAPTESDDVLQGEYYAAAGAYGGESPVKITGIRFIRLVPPVYNVSGALTRSRTPPRRWLEIEVSYETSVQWLSALRFACSLYMTDRTSGEQVCESTTVRYTNVKKGVHKSVVYLSPTTLERFNTDPSDLALSVTGDNRHVLAWYEGNGHREWGLTSNLGRIRGRDETPFRLVNYQDYEPSDPVTRAARPGQ